MFSSEFFPTPASITHKMLNRISRHAENILEPSAGKGDIADVIMQAYRHGRVHVDCIESNQELVHILMGKKYPVVGYDWLTYTGVSFYDAIVMNPPFSNGDDHLLKAWSFLHSGEIVCLLNQETINNPGTASRKLLAEIIRKHGTVEPLGQCFKTAQRACDVNVAMVYLKKVAEDDRVDVWSTKTEEKVATGDINAEDTMLAIKDSLGNMQHYYDEGNEHMLKAFRHIRKAAEFMRANNVHVGQDYETIISMALGNLNSASAEFHRKHRRDSWHTVFQKTQFHRLLDKKQRDELLRDVDQLGNIPFTAANIKGTLENVYEQRRTLFEKSVANVFDELTKYFNGNTNYEEGWKTNDTYKVNKKIIFPWGCEFDGRYCHDFKLRYGGSSIDIYNDLDRILAVLAGDDFEKITTVETAMRNAFRALGTKVLAPFNNQCQSKYFDIRFFKKGTVHLVFRDHDLWAKFNIAASSGKKWLGQATQ